MCIYLSIYLISVIHISVTRISYGSLQAGPGKTVLKVDEVQRREKVNPMNKSISIDTLLNILDIFIERVSDCRKTFDITITITIDTTVKSD